MEKSAGEFGYYLPQGTKEIHRIARELRQRETRAEEILWQRLRSRRLLGRKFRRQHPIGCFVADFFCDDDRLVIEVDGAVHKEATQQERDRYREECLREHTLQILRFSNERIFYNIEQVIKDISDFLLTHTFEAEAEG